MRYTLHLATFPQLPPRAERFMHAVLLDHPLPETIRRRVCWEWHNDRGATFIQFFINGNPVITTRLVPGMDDASHIAKSAHFVVRSIVTYSFIHQQPSQPHVADPDDTVCTDHN